MNKTNGDIATLMIQKVTDLNSDLCTGHSYSDAYCFLLVRPEKARRVPSRKPQLITVIVHYTICAVGTSYGHARACAHTLYQLR
jgi:hypothetical protein